MQLHPIFSLTAKPIDISGLAGDDPKKKKDIIGDEMRLLTGRQLKYDNNKTAKEVALSAAKRAGIDPSFLYSSAFQEGMNQAISKQDNVSDAYNNALAKDKTLSGYPVDGFLNYGVDTFGNNYSNLKKYLPEGFDQRFKFYDALNEKKEKIRTAAFKSNEDALVAKSAFLKMEMDNVRNYAKKKGVNLDNDDLNYFTLASYNGGSGNMQKIMDEYAASADKKKFIKEGLTTRGAVHKNISPRLQRMALAAELLK